jgi:hypothetical protein
MADVYKPVQYAGWSTEKEHPFESPVREIYNILVFIGWMGQQVAKKIICHQIRINPAVLAGKQAVRFL